jgi:hypothetical protein
MLPFDKHWYQGQVACSPKTGWKGKQKHSKVDWSKAPGEEAPGVEAPGVEDKSLWT